VGVYVKNERVFALRDSSCEAAVQLFDGQNVNAHPEQIYL
jgi:hypothetical protein